MTHLNLDTQPEIVRQFVLALAVPPEGVLLESAGLAVACVLPPPQSINGADAQPKAWTEKNNQRRCELIDRKYDRGLTPAEEAELGVLQDGLQRYIDLVAPLPLDVARSLQQELLQKAARVQGPNPV